jgi:predicted flap endonuclease-1-like 5' DNA nuclease
MFDFCIGADGSYHFWPLILFMALAGLLGYLIRTWMRPKDVAASGDMSMSKSMSADAEAKIADWENRYRVVLANQDNAVNEWKLKVQAAEDRAKTFQSQLTDLGSENDKLSTDSGNWSGRVRAMQEERDAALAKLNEARATIVSHETKLSDSETKLQTAYASMNTAAPTEDWEGRYKAAMDEVDKAKSMLTPLKEQLDSKDKRVIELLSKEALAKEYMTRADALGKDNEELKKQLQDLAGNKSAADEAQTKIAALQAQLDAANKAKADVDAAHAKAKADAEAHASKATALGSEMEAVNKNAIALKAQLDANAGHAETAKKLQAELEGAKAAKDAADKAANEWKAKHEQAAAAGAGLNEANAKASGLQSQLDEANSKVNSLQSQLTASTANASAASNLQTELNAAKAARDAAQKDASDWKAKHDAAASAGAQLNDANAKLSSLQSQLNEANSKLNASAANANAASNLQAELNAAKAARDAAQKDASDWKTKHDGLQRLQAELDAAKAARDAAQKDAGDWKTKHDALLRLQAELDAAKSARANAQKELDEMKAKHHQQAENLNELRLEIGEERTAKNKRIAELEAALAAQKAAPAPMATAAPKAAVAKDDDLEVVEGVGPKVNELLRGAGITTWRQLSNTSPDRIREILNGGGERFRILNPNSWPKQAKLLADGDMDGFKKYADYLIAGVDPAEMKQNAPTAPVAKVRALPKGIKADDLKIVEGIGPVIEAVLHNEGIKTWAHLAQTKPERIKEILIAKDPSKFRMHDPTTWPDQSRLADEDKWDELKKMQDALKGGRA